MGKIDKNVKMARPCVILCLVAIFLSSFARTGRAQQPAAAQQTGPLPTTVEALPDPPAAALQPSFATPVHVVEERRVVKGADGQWYFVDEVSQVPPTAAEDKDAAAKDNTMSWKSLSDGISKMLTVTIDGQGKLQFYGFPRGDLYYGTNKFYPSLESPFWVVSNDPRLRTGPLNVMNFPTIPSPPGEGVPVRANDPNFAGNARLSRIGLL